MINRVVIDSSVWMDYFRPGKNTSADQVNLLLDEGRATLCGMIELEILQGLREKEQTMVQDLFRVLHFIDSRREDFIAAGLMLNQLRKKGITIPSSDCLIAAQCIREGLPLFTLDNDFKQIPALKKYKV
jgi:tRNA(fMet)-specific endonuclease VapC